ncbi:MAG: N-6 DNA methylase [Flavobacteriales bacterium]|nr:N-6 DNA methylase [Flavobacteriales bacterium]
MLDSTTKRRIDDCRDILVGKVPDPKSQIDQITVALIYKFMHDMDQQAVELGGTPTFFAKHTVQVNGKDEVKDFAQYAWPFLMATALSGEDRVKLYAEALEKMPENPGLPPLFRDIFKNTYLPYRDPATLREFLKRINEFTYDHSEKLGDAFEYLLSIMGSQGDAGQFRTPRHLIDFMTAVIDPQKHETILDPACGTAGFLISAYKHILRHTSSNHAADDPLAFQLHGVKQEDLTVSAKRYTGDRLTPDQRKKLVRNIVGYDIDPGMVKLSLVNLYLHGFPEPHIHEYDTLTSTDRWEERYDVILANPPFMSPKGGIQPHGKFGIPSTRSEVLFVDYIAEHLNPNGRALVVVPEGIIFQSGKAYKALRRKLVDEHYLVGVVSIPGGVFNPYSGVKTSLLWFDRALARKTDKLLFVKVEADGFDLGAQRRPIAQNDLPEAFALLQDYKRALAEGVKWEAPTDSAVQAFEVERSRVSSTADCSLSGDRYKNVAARDERLNMVALGELMPRGTESLDPRKSPDETFELWSIPAFDTGSPERTKGADIGSAKKVVLPGDVLLSRIVPHIRRAWVVEPSAMKQRQIGSGEWIIFRSEDANPHYLKRILVSDPFHEQFMRTITGVGGSLTRANPEAVREIQIPLPPLAEQEALVAEVEGYQRVIDGARQVLAHYKPRITIDPQWEMVELGEVCDFTRGPFGGSLKKEIFVPSGYAVYEQGHAIYDQFDDVRYFITAEKFGEMKRFEVRPGDVIMSCSGTMGKVAIVPEHVRPGIINQALLKLVPRATLLKEYLKHWMDSDNFQETLGRLTMGAAIQNVASVSVLKNLQIPLPPLAEQQRIVAELEEERRLVAANTALVARMEAKVRERVARVWSSGSSVAARPSAHSFGIARPDTPADDRTIRRSDDLQNGSEPKPVSTPYSDADEEVPMAAEPSPEMERRGPGRIGPGRPRKGEGGNGQAAEAIRTYLHGHPGWHGKGAVLEATGVEASAWNAAIKELLEAGQAERQGEKKGARYRGV